MLIADDTPAVRSLMRRFLEPAGYEVLDACCARDAIAIASTRTDVNVLIADLVMPDMDAFELAEQMRKRSPATRVLFVSGYTEIPGVEAFLPKPFTAQELTDAVARLTDLAA